MKQVHALASTTHHAMEVFVQETMQQEIVLALMELYAKEQLYALT